MVGDHVTVAEYSVVENVVTGASPVTGAVNPLISRSVIPLSADATVWPCMEKLVAINKTAIVIEINLLHIIFSPQTREYLT